MAWPSGSISIAFARPWHETAVIRRGVMPFSTSLSRCTPDSIVVLVPNSAIELAGWAVSASWNTSTPQSTMPSTGMAAARRKAVCS